MKGMVSRAFRAKDVPIVASGKGLLCVPHQSVCSRDPLDPVNSTDNHRFWIADPWAEYIALNIENGVNIMNADLTREDLVFLRAPRLAPSANKNASDRPPRRTANTSEKRYVHPVDRSRRFARLQTGTRRGTRASKNVFSRRLANKRAQAAPVPVAGAPHDSAPVSGTKSSATSVKPIRETIDRANALYNNELLYCINRFEIRPLFEFGRHGAVQQLAPHIMQVPLDNDPTILLRRLMPGGVLNLESADGVAECRVIPPWVYEYFIPTEPGALYRGHDFAYVWYPIEIDPLDALHYRTYMSVVSRIDYIERLIRDPRLTGNVRRQLVSVQDSYVMLTCFMMANEVYTDLELWSPFVGEGVPHESKNVTLPSGKSVQVEVPRIGSHVRTASYDLRIETVWLQLFGHEHGMDWKTVPGDGSTLAEYGPDYSNIWHLGLVPNLSAFIEFIGMTGERDKYDIPFDDPDVRDILDILQKACPSPLSRRDCSGLLRGKIRDKPLLYSVFYKMTIASLCGYYNMDRRATSFYLRSAIYRNFIFDECDPNDFLEWMNGQETVDISGLDNPPEVFHKQFTTLSIISEYLFFMIKSLPHVHTHMTNNFYLSRIMQNLADTMDEFRTTMDCCLYGEDVEWEHFQNNHERYSMFARDKRARSKLTAQGSSLYTEYDAHFVNLSGSKYDFTRFLSNPMMYCIIRFLIESLYQRPTAFDLGRIAMLHDYLEVPYLWVCRGGRESDTLESVISDVTEDKMTIYSAVMALAIRAEVLLIPASMFSKPKQYTRHLMCKITSCLLRRPLVAQYGDQPWKLFGFDSFAEVLRLYTGPGHSAWTDFRAEFYEAHGVRAVWYNKPCSCSFCKGERNNLGDQWNDRLQYRRFQQMHCDNELAPLFFGHRVNRITEDMMSAAYHYRLQYMYRVTHMPFVQYMVLVMEGIMLEVKNKPHVQRASDAITEEERRLVAMYANSGDQNNISMWVLLLPPIECEARNIIQMIRVKNLYTTNSNTSHVRSILRAMVDECCRDFLLLYMFYYELLIRQSTRFFALPLSWTQMQLRAIERKYKEFFSGSPRQPLSSRVGVYHYCPIHGDFKASVVHRRCGELPEFDAQYQIAIGTTNFAADVERDLVYCRTAVVNDFKQRNRVRAAISLPGTTVGNRERRYGAVSMFEVNKDGAPDQQAEYDQDDDDDDEAQAPVATEKRPRKRVKKEVASNAAAAAANVQPPQPPVQRRSKITRLQSLHSMCTKPNIQIQMIGSMLVTYNRRIILCPRCANPLIYNRSAFDMFGINCGQCTLQEARMLPVRISDFLFFTCILCAKRSRFYDAHEINCVSVINDTLARQRPLCDVYLCERHMASKELEQHLPNMTLSMLRKAAAGYLVLVEQTPDGRATIFGLTVAHAHNNIVHWRVPDRLSRKAATTYEFRRRANLNQETLEELTNLSEYQNINATDL